MKGQKFLKVTSILMIIGGVLGAVIGILGMVGAIGLNVLAEGGAGMLIFSAVLAIVGSVIQLIAGIKGVDACSNPSKAASCVVWGIIVAALCVVSMILSVVNGGKFDIVSLLLNLVIPALYVYGAVQMKSSK